MTAPLLLLALVVGPVVNLSWIPGEPQVQTGFLVERADAGLCSFVAIGRTDASTTVYLDAPAILDKPYAYQVRAVIDSQPGLCGVSPQSNTVVATPTAGGLPDVTQSFTFAGSSATYMIDLGTYQCVRRVGGTARLSMTRGGTILAERALANPAKGATFTMRCAQLPTAVNLFINDVLQLTAPLP